MSIKCDMVPFRENHGRDEEHSWFNISRNDWKEIVRPQMMAYLKFRKDEVISNDVVEQLFDSEKNSGINTGKKANIRQVNPSKARTEEVFMVKSF